MLSTEYAELAGELAAVLAAVQGGAWEGPAAESYLAAHTPYLAWLMEASADSAGEAAGQEVAAAAYVSALAGMPTLPDLAANHAIHGVLVATNFFGINTIPIALNEADYVRMWIQAATTMATYQTTAAAAVATAPHTTAAPQITKMDMNGGSGMNGGGGMNGGVGMNGGGMGNMPGMGTSLPTTFDQWLQAIFPPQFNPFSPHSFSMMYPSLANFLPRVEQMIPMYASNPSQLIQAVLLLGTQFVVHRTLFLTWIILNNPGMLGTFITANPIYSAALAAPLVTAPAVASGGFAGLSGLAGLAGVSASAIPVPVAPTPLSAPPLPNAAGIVGSSPSVAPTPAPAPVPPPPPPPPPPAPPPFVGTEGAVGGQNLAYSFLVGGVGAEAKSSARSRVGRTSSAPAAAPAAAATPQLRPQQARSRRPRRTLIDRGYRHEYLDLAPEVADAGASGTQGSESAGFDGVAFKTGVLRPSGLATLAGHTFGGGPIVPMVPDSWDADADEDR